MAVPCGSDRYGKNSITYNSQILLLNVTFHDVQDLSRDPRIEVAVKADPLIKAYGTFGGINDMLAAVRLP